MIILPAIDLYEGKAVRLYKGDYAQMTVYSDDPTALARKFAEAGAAQMHMVDLEGAKNGTTPNLELVERCVRESGLLVEVGGGIRDMQTVERYLACGVGRVILGTAAAEDPELLAQAVQRWGEKIAAGADVKDGRIAVKGWMEQSAWTLEAFLQRMETIGVRTVICTDISRDGAMRGSNLELYRTLAERFSLQLIASGGVSSMEDIRALRQMGLYGAIVGKAYYTGAIDLREAIEVAK